MISVMLICCIQFCDFPVYCNEVKLQTTKSYRYVRYVSSKVSKSALAELAFFCNEKEIKGRAMGEGLSPPSQNVLLIMT